jgi:two-component sensor histidine kinase
LHSRIPERLAHRVPPFLVELAVGTLVAAAMVTIRLPFSSFTGDRAPYALNFLAVVIAAVLAGWRAGLIALLLGQFLTWLIIVPPYWSIAIADAERLGGLGIATISQLLILIVIALYQREVDKGTAERERRLELLDQARRELDHRAKNNYQTVLSLIQLQAAREKDISARNALQQVAERIAAISFATEHLAMRGEDLATVRLRDHLCELCAQLERGLAHGEIQVECDVPDVTASADTAIHLAIIVNELVTNALKHAFQDGGKGRVQVRSQVAGRGLEIEVSDDGRGINGRSPRSGSGLGMKLVETFAKHLNAEHDVSSSPEGTRHRILVPALA